MAIPIYLNQFKSAGVYKVVYDKSTILSQDSEIMRLVVGYSEKGPFNIPVYVKDSQTFTTLFGGISKKLEKRGIFFHRIALQCLNESPIICLNLKKFSGETLEGATINTDFNPNLNIIDTVNLNVEDIYDTARFWELNADNLNNKKSVEGKSLDQYINICATNVKSASCTYFIRKASGTKVSEYNITVNDWYSDNAEEMPEYLENYKNNLISDFFAEIYVFKGKFDPNQVLASDTLKNYFVSYTGANNETGIKLRPYVLNAYNEPVDTLDVMFNDSTSNPIGHYIGALIPYFKNKKGSYVALDILFNNEQDVHNMMMSFNTEMLEEENGANLDLSGRKNILIEDSVDSSVNNSCTIDKIFAGTASSSLLGNNNAKIIADKITFSSNVYDVNEKAAAISFSSQDTSISGILYVNAVSGTNITLKQVGTEKSAVISFNSEENAHKAAEKLGVTFENNVPVSGKGTYYTGENNPFEDADNPLNGPDTVITSVTRIYKTDSSSSSDDDDSSSVLYSDNDLNLKVKTLSTGVSASSETLGANNENNVYGSSVSFIKFNDGNWEYKSEIAVNGESYKAIIGSKEYDNSLLNILQKGDCLLKASISGDYFDNVYVLETGTEYDENGEFKQHYIIISDEPVAFEKDSEHFYVRVDKPLNQEIGEMIPQYLEGYTYKNDKPNGTGMYAKLQWQKFILSALSDYKGLRTGLLEKSEIDYRYIVDTFESFPDEELKKDLSYLAKQKQSCFVIANFPAIKTFVKCPYTSFTDSNNVFNIQYVVDGYNKKKSSSIKFSLPSDVNGASFIAFYTPLKFSDSYVDTIVPSAGLVSNLFVEKYKSRQPYYIVAGPNYGVITANQLVGPDYKFSRDELNIIEPYGVNCMVYRPGFGTFINANQTAKQRPLSALSRVNVRELVIYLQDEIEKVLQAYQWEFNNATTRNAILDKANYICSIIAGNGGIQAYENIMDESNNTPEIIDNEFAILSTKIEPGFGCGKMVHELTIYRTGQISSNTVES